MKKVLVILASLVLFISCSCPPVRINGLTAVLQSNKIVEEMNLHHVVITDFPGETRGCAGIVVGLDALYTYILTAGHCTFNTKIGPLAGVFVANTFQNPRHYARVIARDWINDLTLVRTRVLGSVSPAKLAKNMPKVGEAIWVIGAPGGRNKVVTKGILSQAVWTNNTGGKGFLTDASITNGNSGGGVYNTQGELIGMMVEMHGKRAFSLAMHLDVIKNFLKENNL